MRTRRSTPILLTLWLNKIRSVAYPSSIRRATYKRIFTRLKIKIMAVTILCPFFLLLFTYLGRTRRETTFDTSFMSFDQTDILRAIAVCLIISSHASCSTGQRIFTPLGGGGVALFLICSGYGITKSFMNSGLGNYWTKKILRIWLPYDSFLLFLLIIKNGPKYDSLSQLFLDFTCINTSYWYFSFLVYNYALFFVCHKFKILQKYKYPIFLLGLGLLFVPENNIRSEQVLSYPIGMWLADYDKYIFKYLTKNNILVVAIAFAIIGITCLAGKQLHSIRSLGEDNILMRLLQLGLKTSIALFLVSILQLAPPPDTGRYIQK